MKTLLSMGLRGLALVAKLLLLFYLVREVSLAAAGLYGLVQAATVLGSRIMGWGLYFEANRALVGLPPLAAARLVRDQHLIYVVGYLGLWLTMPWWGAWLGVDLQPLLPLVLALVLTNHLLVEWTQILLARHQALLANIALFLNSGWALVAVALGLLLPAYQNLETVLWCWLLATLLALALCAWGRRDWPWLAALGSAVQWRWLMQALLIGTPLFVALGAQLGSQYFDRFILSWQLDATAVGLFVMFWSFANALQVLVQTALLQQAQPRLVALAKAGQRPALVAELHRLHDALHWLIWPCGLLLLLGLGPLLLLLQQPAALAAWPVLALLLFAAGLRLLAELCQFGLYARRQDRALVWSNLAALLVAIIAIWVLVPLWGLVGAGVAAVAAAFMLLGWQMLALRNDLAAWRRNEQSQRQAGA